MLRKVSLIVVIAFMFLIAPVYAFDINTYITKQTVRKALHGYSKFKAHIYTDKQGNQYKIPAMAVQATNYKAKGSCDYTWSVNVPVYSGPGSPTGTKTITGTGKKIQAADVGTVTFIKSDDGTMQYISIHKSDGFKSAILNGNINALAKLNQITEQFGYYYKAIVKMGTVRNPRTGETKTIKTVLLKKVKSAEEATIEDQTTGGENQ
jgi:hypothetical protein